MADTKISALTAATTPLAGTEVLPIVQSSTTKQVSVANLTAGRSVSAASLSLTTTPLAVTSGGTGLSAVAQGDLLYGSASNTLSALAKNTTATRYLSNTGTSNNPAWAQVDLSNGVTGTLPVANGGTAKTSLTANQILYGSFSQSSGLYFDGTSYVGIGTSTVNPQSVTSGITFDTPTAGNYFSLDFKTAGTLRTRLTGNSSATYFGTQTATPLYLETNGATTAVLFSSGGVSIGNTTDPGAGALRLSNNLVQGTAAKGINFTANSAAAGMTSQLLNWYEEGTFTCGLKGYISNPTTAVNTTAYYTRIGRQVTVYANFSNVNTTGASGDVYISGLPFTPGVGGVGSVILDNFDLNTGTGAYIDIAAGQTNAFLYSDKTSAVAQLIQHSAGTSRSLRFTATYFV